MHRKTLFLNSGKYLLQKQSAAQQKSLDSLTKVLDNRIALDYLLVELSGVYDVVSTSCCTWINTSGKVETQLHKIDLEGTGLSIPKG